MQDTREQLDTTIPWFRRAWEVLKLLGWNAPVLAALGATWLWAVHRVDSLALWQAGLATMGLLLLVLLVMVAARHLLVKLGVSTPNAAKVGRYCLQFHEELTQYIGSQHETVNRRPHPTMLPDREAGRVALEEDMEQQRQLSNRIKIHVLTRFSHRLLAVNRMIDTLGVRAPAISDFGYNAMETASYIGTVGELLSRGHLEEARKLRPEPLLREMNWHLGG